MNKLFGNIKGLKASQLRKIDNLYRRKTPPEFIVTPELARDVSRLSFDINRQIGLLIDRKGKIPYVIVGNHHEIVIPDTPEYRSAPGRLRGIRCVHTHLDDEPLATDDLTDLGLAEAGSHGSHTGRRGQPSQRDPHEPHSASTYRPTDLESRIAGTWKNRYRLCGNDSVHRGRAFA